MMVPNDYWDSDSGLGKGKLYPVKTVLKRDRRGLRKGESVDAPRPKGTRAL